MSRILIVEDDSQIARSLELNLKFNGHETEAASTVADAWEVLRNNHFDLVCMDVGLPDGNGFDLCEKIRNDGNTIPILFLSARTDEASVVKAITKGGDDYIRKPFGIEELKVRMNKLLRKFHLPDSIISFGELKIDPVQKIVTVMDKIVALGRKELEILILLTKKAGEIVSRESILEALYENTDPFDRTVDSHISHLRKKLRDVAGPSLQISSVYGLGYRLEWNKQ